MPEVKTIERYEIRGNIVWDRKERRPASLSEIKSALEFWSTTKAVIAELKSRGMYDEPF